jgi:hypothetical protein
MSSAANGVMYTVSASGIALTNAAQDLLEILAAAGVPILLHSYRIAVEGTIVSGVTQDVRARVRTCVRSTAGTGGVAITPRAVNQRNTLAAAGTYTRNVTTPGTIGNILSADQINSLYPLERKFSPAERILIPGGSRLALNLESALGAGVTAWSLEAYVEEV